MYYLRRFAAAVFLCSVVHAQSPLSDYRGTYAYANGQTLEMITSADELFAVIDEAKYSLKRVGGDEFRNPGNQKVGFTRDGAGQITGFREASGVLHRRLSRQVSAESEALTNPRAGRASDNYTIPRDRHEGIAVGDISQSLFGLPVATTIITGILNGTWNDVHSVLLYHGGKLVLEEYFYGYTPERAHQLRSATKSVVSALAGIAIDRGALPEVGDPAFPHLAYSAYRNPDPAKTRITIKDFLTMSSGLACNDHDSSSPGRETVIDEQPDWVKATLDLPLISKPGTVGYYCSGGVAVVGRIVENAVHAYLPNFAQASLFGPLGIARSAWQWNYNLTNADQEYSQIHLRPRDMLKLGLLYAQGGNWQGHQVISSSWVRESLRRQSTVDDTDYGYFWWRPWLAVNTPSGMQRVYLNAAQGNGGQKIYLVPQYDLIAVFTGGAYNANGSPPNKIMATVILPALMVRHR
jgi:CubicO group peptidase (beta-lactamase class C family)